MTPLNTLKLGALATCGVSLLAPAAFGQISIDATANYFVGTEPSGMTAGDFDGDGDVDLATTVDGPDRVAILLNSGSGTYVLGPSAFLPASSSPQDIEAGDLDGDGDMDLAVAVRDPAGTVHILLNSGTGAFVTAASVPVGDRPRGLSIADVNGDGDLDIAVANRDDGTAHVLTNSGTGTFTTQLLAVGGEPRDTAFGDFDGDGDLDLAVTEHDSRTVITYANTGGSFSQSMVLSVGPLVRPEGVDAADLDGNGTIDLAVGVSDQTLNINQAMVFLNFGGFGAPVGYNTGGQNTGQIVATDFDCDGLVDLATSNTDSANVSFLRNTGGGVFLAGPPMAAGTSPGEITTADFDGDGDADLASANRDSNNVSVFPNASCSPVTPCPADINGDGFVAVGDLTALILAWGSNPGHPADLDGNGFVDVQDLTTLILAWGMCP